VPDSSLHPDDRFLVERLRAEAADARPAFSRPLHERIMVSVAAAEPSSAADPWQRRRYWQPVLAAAAVIALCALPWAWYAMQSSAPEVQQPVQIAQAPPPDVQAAPEAAAIPLTFDVHDAFSLAPDLASYQWAYLDQDARTAAEGLLREMPLDLGPPE